MIPEKKPDTNLFPYTRYERQVIDYITTRNQDLTSVLSKGNTTEPSVLKLHEVGIFLKAIAESLPIFTIEQFAPQSAEYSSARGAVYNWINLQRAQNANILNPNTRSAIFLNHAFRCSANSMDALVDETPEVPTRHNIRENKNTSTLTNMFLESKKNYFAQLKNMSRNNPHHRGTTTAAGNSAVRYQIHQDLFFDSAQMKKSGINNSQYFSHIPKPPPDYYFTRDQTGILILLGLDAETLHTDCAVPAKPDLSHNSRAREAGFWAGVMGTLGDQLSDILQDVCSDPDGNMFVTFADNFPQGREKVLDTLHPFIEEATALRSNPTAMNQLKFFKLQIDAHKALNKKVPQLVDAYGGLINRSFLKIPEEFQKDFIPMRIASWDMVSLYQLSDFLLHKDQFETMARTSQI